MDNRLGTVFLWGILSFAVAAEAAPEVGQVDDFQDGTTQGWRQGDFAPSSNVTNVSGGGPAGEGDRYLRVEATGGDGPGSMLVVFNEAARWTGNYLERDVDAITMDLMNPGSVPLSMRIAFFHSTFTGMAATEAFVLPADGQWHSATFGLSEGDLTGIAGGVYNTVMSNVFQFRILHSTNPDFRGETIAAAFGADNITAVSLAEPQPLPGDANRDGRVDGEDFLIWQASFGIQSGAAWDDGDFNGDGRVDGEDFLIWQAHFGTVAGSSAVTPEPAALSVLMAAGAGVLVRRRR